MYRTYAQIPNNISLGRYFLLKPFIFETLSTLMQMRDLRRRARIARTSFNDSFLQKVAAYNAGVTKLGFTRTRRTEKCYVALTQGYARLPYIMSGKTDVQLLGTGLENERLLIVGPRNVHELLLAWLYGFAWKNIYAVDLYSTNPKILQMDMNALGFKDGAFDAVSIHSTLGYSRDIRATLTELHRVLKPTGRLVFQHGFTRTSQPPGDFVGENLSGNEMAKHLRALGFHVTAIQTTYAFASQGDAFGTEYFVSVQKTDPKSLGFDVIDE